MSRQKSLGLGSGHKGFRFRHLPLPLLVLGILFAALQDKIALFQHTTGDNGISQRDEAEHDDSLRNNNNFPPILEKDGDNRSTHRSHADPNWQLTAETQNTKIGWSRYVEESQQLASLWYQ